MTCHATECANCRTPPGPINQYPPPSQRPALLSGHALVRSPGNRGTHSSVLSRTHTPSSNPPSFPPPPKRYSGGGEATATMSKQNFEHLVDDQLRSARRSNSHDAARVFNAASQYAIGDSTGQGRSTKGRGAVERTLSFSEFLSFCTFPKDELEDVATRLQDKRVFGDPNDDQNYAYFVKKSKVGWVAVAIGNKRNGCFWYNILPLHRFHSRHPLHTPPTHTCRPFISQPTPTSLSPQLADRHGQTRAEG